MPDRCCPTCNQPLPAPQRIDPPLPPLERPAVVTIHDLPEGERARAVVEVEDYGWGKFRRLKVGDDG